MSSEVHRKREVLAEADASVQFVDCGLQCILEMLADSGPDKRIHALGLRALLTPMADQASQAASVTRMLSGRQRR
jgi:hypothetical protein